MDLQHDIPPLPVENSTVSGLSSAVVENDVTSGLVSNELSQSNILGSGLQCILESCASDDSEMEEGQSSNSSNSGDNEDLGLFEGNALVQPNVAHLQLGMVQTFFYPINYEDEKKKFSPRGMAIWEKYFAPHMESDLQKKGSLCKIPVSWFNFITLMLLTPEKFDWTSYLLKSPLWDIVSASDTNEQVFLFDIPDKCVSSLAPSCKIVELNNEADLDPLERLLPPAAPKRKRRGDNPLVESKVRRSPRIVEINKGFKKHSSCNDKNCLPCNAKPPVSQKKVIKNLATSFCKVAEKDYDTRVKNLGSKKEKELKDAEADGSKLQDKKKKMKSFPK
jgi:hypothetical protein